KERENYFTKQEVAAADYLYRNARPGSLLIGGVNDYPWAFENYERYGYASLDVLSKPEREKVLARPVAGIERMVEDGHFPLGYVIITRSQKAAVDATGVLPRGSLRRLERVLAGSTDFRTIYRNPDATILLYKPGGVRP